MRPDFLFPSQAAYRDPAFPAERLRMLAAKTTLKERWGQVLREADRIPVKHILTLQEGVSESDFREITGAGIVLVVPQALHQRFPKPVRSSLLTLEAFLAEVRLLSPELRA
ncbi:type II restriction endonuclease [Sphingopyxis sp. MC1]|uniref:type II restriction endonuclease n=1 Tax=Sphingopyxis sp. MC1 TaxID=1174684 RepID=UPI0022AC5EB5|nr:type II restriction endonuclease [Sphingopyxis sp. MC1]